MIQYKGGTFAVAFAFQWTGSIIPKALVWAVPAAVCAALLQFFLGESEMAQFFSSQDVVDGISAYSYSLTFLLSFRASLAYNRLWEGMSFLQMMRGSWINCVSSCVAFTSPAPEKADEVEQFLHQLVRLVSLLHAAALQSVSNMHDTTLEVIDYFGFEDDVRLDWLSERPERAEIVAQWIRRLMMQTLDRGVLSAPPPILSRAVQELDRGIVDLNNARRINLIPFPFPYAQMVTIALLLHTFFVTLSGVSRASPLGAAFVAFLSVVVLWSINYVACEIEAPFGDDLNDLPIFELQQDMNSTLISALHPNSTSVPCFHYDREQHDLVDNEFIYRHWQTQQGAFLAKKHFDKRRAMHFVDGSGLARRAHDAEEEKEDNNNLTRVSAYCLKSGARHTLLCRESAYQQHVHRANDDAHRSDWDKGDDAADVCLDAARCSQAAESRQGSKKSTHTTHSAKSTKSVRSVKSVKSVRAVRPPAEENVLRSSAVRSDDAAFVFRLLAAALTDNSRQLRLLGDAVTKLSMEDGGRKTAVQEASGSVCTSPPPSKSDTQLGSDPLDAVLSEAVQANGWESGGHGKDVVRFLSDVEYKYLLGGAETEAPAEPAVAVALVVEGKPAPILCGQPAAIFSGS
eukprot:TRINITY_DN6612_c0_g1_i1.p1 TRINITY_DN6612_c0_g1~~TRINITY_DN6612_c0_g1_i1.p1  ORF type:complete len:628 (+),score=119.37 TRINITY_DN6612_c0_g1_i1:123-2006(+)